LKVEYVNSGLGNNFGDLIEINKNLLNYPELHNAVLAHELEHSSQAFTIYDLKLDLSKPKVNSWDMLKFMVKYPKSFSQMLPFYYSKKHGFVYDINLIIIYFAAICLFSLVSLIAFSI